eukprot:scpid90826/ scgid5490/ 
MGSTDGYGYALAKARTSMHKSRTTPCSSGYMSDQTQVANTSAADQRPMATRKDSKPNYLPGADRPPVNNALLGIPPPLLDESYRVKGSEQSGSRFSQAREKVPGTPSDYLSPSDCLLP